MICDIGRRWLFSISIQLVRGNCQISSLIHSMGIQLCSWAFNFIIICNFSVSRRFDSNCVWRRQLLLWIKALIINVIDWSGRLWVEIAHFTFRQVIHRWFMEHCSSILIRRWGRKYLILSVILTNYTMF